MGKQKSRDGVTGVASDATGTPAMIDGAAAPASPASEGPTPVVVRPEAPVEEPALPPRIEVASIESPPVVPDVAAGGGPDVGPRPAERATAADEPRTASEQPPAAARSQGSRFALLAATLALAAGIGGMIGAIGAVSFMRAAPASAPTARPGLEEILALKENVVQARVELAAIKAGLETASRGTNAQLTKIAERIDRIERGQAEPAARISKAVDALERMAKAEAAKDQARDVTGSVTPMSATPPAQAAIAGAPGKPALVEGWVVRDVHRGTALLEGRMGLIEVDQGDVVPGLGRVEAIRKQDGRWVVLTSKGMIAPAR